MIQPLVYCIRDQISLEIYTEKGGQVRTIYIQARTAEMLGTCHKVTIDLILLQHLYFLSTCIILITKESALGWGEGYKIQAISGPV